MARDACCGGCVRRRRLDQPGDERRFVNRESLRRLAEVSARSRLHAVVAVAQVHLVQIDFEDLVLAERVLDADGQKRLPHLAAQGLVVAEKGLARQLLGNRRPALRAAARAKIRDECPADAPAVQAVVLVEAPVFGGQHGMNQVRRNVGEAHRDAPFLEHGEDRLAVLVVNRGGRGQVAHLTDGLGGGRADPDVCCGDQPQPPRAIHAAIAAQRRGPAVY